MSRTEEPDRRDFAPVRPDRILLCDRSMRISLRMLSCGVLALAACGPDPATDTLSVSVSRVENQLTFNWTDSGASGVSAAEGAPVGTLAVYPCDDGGCPPGTYRDAVTASPYWYITREDYTECTFAQLSGPVTYGQAPPFLSAQRAQEAGPAPLGAGKRFVVVIWRYGGCLAGGPLFAGRAEFTVD